MASCDITNVLGQEKQQLCSSLLYSVVLSKCGFTELSLSLSQVKCNLRL